MNTSPLAIVTIEFQEQNDVDNEDEENSRAAKYHLLPWDGRANRVLVMGTVTEIEQVSDNPLMLRAKIINQTGSFFTYAGQFNPDDVFSDDLLPFADDTFDWPVSDPLGRSCSRTTENTSSMRKGLAPQFSEEPYWKSGIPTA